MKKWEYYATELLEEANRLGFKEMHEVLNKYGEEGWELVSVTDATLYTGTIRNTRFFAFFKRQKT